MYMKLNISRFVVWFLTDPEFNLLNIFIKQLIISTIIVYCLYIQYFVICLRSGCLTGPSRNDRSY